MSRVERISLHDHEFHQWLVYLRGSGTQILPGLELSVRRGDAVLIPKNTLHGFRRHRSIRPLCLSIGFEEEHISNPTKLELSHDTQHRLERELTALDRLDDAHSATSGAMILGVYALLAEALSGRSSRLGLPIARQIDDLLARLSPDRWQPNTVAKKLSTDLPRLNRRLRAEGSPPVGKLIANCRLNRSRNLLSHTFDPIHEVALQVGLLDANYFSRWFLAQSGQSPKEYRDEAS